MKKLNLLALACLMAMQTTPAWADDLLTIYQQALEADPKVNTAALQIEIGEAQKGQAMGAMYPQINANANVSANNYYTNPRTADPNYQGRRYTLSMTQSLIDFTKFWNWRKTQKVVDQVTAENIDAHNKLMYDVTTRYFKALEAEDQLSFTQMEKEATQKQLLQVQKQYAKEMVKITDLYEIQARLDKILADEIEAENVLAVAKEGLAELTNKAPGTLQKLVPGVIYQPLQGKLDDWVAVARSQNPAIMAKEHAIEAADDNVTAEQSRHLPVLELQLNYTKTNTGFNSSNLRSDAEIQTAAINVNVPLFSGGVTSERVNEAKHRLAVSKNDREATTRAVVKETKDAFLTANTNHRRIEAAEKAVQSAVKSREAMEKGLSYGVQTLSDVLDARQNEFKAKRDLAQAKYGHLASRIRFVYATGTITEENLQEINHWLQK